MRDKANVAHVLFIIGFFWSKTLHFDPFQDLSSSSDMRPAHHTLFRDQVSTLVEWFSHWNDCERTIALYTLLMRISTIQAKFLSLILEHTYREDSYEVQVMQKRANDKGKYHTWVDTFVYFFWNYYEFNIHLTSSRRWGIFSASLVRDGDVFAKSNVFLVLWRR